MAFKKIYKKGICFKHFPIYRLRPSPDTGGAPLIANVFANVEIREQKSRNGANGTIKGLGRR
jgi:hypothetical protein